MSADTEENGPRQRDGNSVVFRNAEVADAVEILSIVERSGVLDANSLYCYLLLCRDFSDTCLVACRDDSVIGFVTAYRPPPKPDTVFVWQIGLAAEARRQGIAKRMLHALVELPGNRDVRFLEATVTPSNTPSRNLFQSFARSRGVPCQVGTGFTADMFVPVKDRPRGGQGDSSRVEETAGQHEPEELFTIGPFHQPHSGTNTL